MSIDYIFQFVFPFFWGFFLSILTIPVLDLQCRRVCTKWWSFYLYLFCLESFKLEFVFMTTFVYYIDIHSNHSTNIIKQLPKMINSRINSISSNKQVFREATRIHQAALDKSGYKCNGKWPTYGNESCILFPGETWICQTQARFGG